MILELQLEHTKERGRRQTHQLFGIDAAGVARVALDKGAKGVQDLVSGIIHQRLPEAFKQFRVAGWRFADHEDAINSGRY
jgi:hypothetical protein